MVSALWNASSEGRLGEVQELLTDASSVDIDIKDDAGVTPLIVAVRNGHIEVVKALLDKGADPSASSSQGPPQHYTQDPAILELLNATQAGAASGLPSNETGYAPNANGEVYPPPGAYPYYPTLNSTPPEGAVFYPPQPQADAQAMGAHGPGNLPPPEIARFIPCRYFPACRYGSSCIFAHPQGPYFTGPLPPPAQYPAPYDPVNASYAPNYYPMPAPSFHAPNNSHPLNTLSSPNGPAVPQGPSSEVVPPPSSQPSFSPNTAPAPVPYPAMSPMMSPNAYPQPGPVPMSAPVPLYHQPPPPPQNPQSPNSMYNPAPPVPSFAVQPNGVPQYPPPALPVPVAYPEVNGAVKSPLLNSQLDAYTPVHVGSRDAAGHARRGSIRRGSFGARKPPCLFFPAGRCKNGDDCRFPHIMPDNTGAPHHSYSNGRGGAPRAPRPHMNGNSMSAVDAKMAALSVRDSRLQGTHAFESPIKPESRDNGNRNRYSQGPKNGGVNGSQTNHNKRIPPQIRQRVPNADEFPVLGNSTTPPAKSGLNGYFPNGTGHAGPTAAQVLQAPPPVKKESSASSSGAVTPDHSVSAKETKSELNVSEPLQPPSTSAIQKLPISFAAIAATGPPETAAEVSVSA